MPARQFQQRKAPSVFIVALLIMAVVVGLVLWATRNSGGEGDGDGEPSVPSGQVETTTTLSSGAGGPVGFVGATSFDPGDVQVGPDNADAASRAIDGNPSTAWSTVCYDNEYFNGKPGVGLILQLSEPAAGTATIDVASAPFQLDVYATDADVAPTTIDGWGSKVVALANGTSPGSVTAEIGASSTYVLVLLRQAGDDNGCKAQFPYQGAITDVSFALD